MPRVTWPTGTGVSYKPGCCSSQPSALRSPPPSPEAAPGKRSPPSLVRQTPTTEMSEHSNPSVSLLIAPTATSSPVNSGMVVFVLVWRPRQMKMTLCSSVHSQWESCLRTKDLCSRVFVLNRFWSVPLFPLAYFSKPPRDQLSYISVQFYIQNSTLGCPTSCVFTEPTITARTQSCLYVFHAQLDQKNVPSWFFAL